MSKNGPTTRGTTGFGHIEVDWDAVLRRKLASDGYVDEHDLVEILRHQSLPPLLKDHLCRFLLGDTGKPKGRRALPPRLRAHRDMLVAGQYRRILSYLSERARRAGAPERKKGDMTPAERAARLVAARYLDGEDSWRGVQNIASSPKRR